MSRSRTARIGGLVLAALLGITMGCGAAAPPSTSNAAAPPPSPSEGTASAVAPPLLTLGAVAWHLVQPLRIDAAGVVFDGSRRMGSLTPHGALTSEDGTVVAHIDDAGWLVMGERRSSLRMVNDAVVEVRDGPESPADAGGERLMRIEGDELVVGSGEEEERIELVGFRPELAREVLFVSAVMMAALASAYAHG